ncbi:MAG: hypothetical protein NC308_07360 [Clostridium sp.]|nr:hypothetical protein [Bacteroides sp.]MCM1198690.1 hypothetical protein [Clostridium sp.]
MERLLSYLLFLAVPLTALAQAPPVWYDSAMREMKYPREAFFTGFAIGEKSTDETYDTAVKRITEEAKVEAASSIRMTVSKVMSSTASSLLTSGSQGFSEVATEEFHSTTMMHTGIKDIPGLVSEVWTDSKKGTIAAFAYVSRKELARKVDRRLTVNMAKAELSVEEILRLKEASRLTDALSEIDRALILFQDIEEDQKLLISVDELYSDEDLQVTKANELKSTILSVRDDLRAGVAVYLDCSSELFGIGYPGFEKELKSALSKLQCHLVDSAQDAERVICVNACCEEHNMAEYSGFKNYFSYVNVDLRMDNPAKGVCLYEGRLSQKGGHTRGYEDAARSGYRDIIGKVVQIIEENLNL